MLVAFWLLYVVAAIGYELREPTAELRLFSASLLLANAALVAGAGWAMLDDTGHSDAATAWVIGRPRVHIGGGIPAYGGRMSKEIAALIMAVGTALAALGLALAIDGPALVAGWSAEALVLAWAARRFGDPRGQIASAAFFTLAVAHTLTFEAPPDALRSGVDDFSTAAIAVVIVGAGGRRAEPPLGAARAPRGVPGHRGDGGASTCPRSRSSPRSRATSSSPARRPGAALRLLGGHGPGRDRRRPASRTCGCFGSAGSRCSCSPPPRSSRTTSPSSSRSTARSRSSRSGLLLLGGAFAYQRIRKEVGE